MKVWVIAIEVMKIIRIIGLVKLRRDAENPKSMIAIRLIWIPGMRPVITPASIPSMSAIIRYNTIHF